MPKPKPVNKLLEKIRAAFGSDPILPENELYDRLGESPLTDSGEELQRELGLFGVRSRNSHMGVAVVEDPKTHTIGEVYFYLPEQEKKLVKDGVISATSHELTANVTPDGAHMSRYELTAAARKK